MFCFRKATGWQNILLEAFACSVLVAMTASSVRAVDEQYCNGNANQTQITKVQARIIDTVEGLVWGSVGVDIISLELEFPWRVEINCDDSWVRLADTGLASCAQSNPNVCLRPAAWGLQESKSCTPALSLVSTGPDGRFVTVSFSAAMLEFSSTDNGTVVWWNVFVRGHSFKQASSPQTMISLSHVLTLQSINVPLLTQSDLKNRTEQNTAAINTGDISGRCAQPPEAVRICDGAATSVEGDWENTTIANASTAAPTVVGPIRIDSFAVSIDSVALFIRLTATGDSGMLEVSLGGESFVSDGDTYTLLDGLQVQVTHDAAPTVSIPLKPQTMVVHNVFEVETPFLYHRNQTKGSDEEYAFINRFEKPQRPGRDRFTEEMEKGNVDLTSWYMKEEWSAWDPFENASRVEAKYSFAVYLMGNGLYITWSDKVGEGWLILNEIVGFMCDQCSVRNQRCVGCAETDHRLVVQFDAPYRVNEFELAGVTISNTVNTNFGAIKSAVTVTTLPTSHFDGTLVTVHDKETRPLINAVTPIRRFLSRMVALVPIHYEEDLQSEWTGGAHLLVDQKKVGRSCNQIGADHYTFVHQNDRCNVAHASCLGPRIDSLLLSSPVFDVANVGTSLIAPTNNGLSLQVRVGVETQFVLKVATATNASLGLGRPIMFAEPSLTPSTPNNADNNGNSGITTSPNCQHQTLEFLKIGDEPVTNVDQHLQAVLSTTIRNYGSVSGSVSVKVDCNDGAMVASADRKSIGIESLKNATFSFVVAVRQKASKAVCTLSAQINPQTMWSSAGKRLPSCTLDIAALVLPFAFVPLQRTAPSMTSTMANTVFDHPTIASSSTLAALTKTQTVSPQPTEESATSPTENIGLVSTSAPHSESVSRLSRWVQDWWRAVVAAAVLAVVVVVYRCWRCEATTTQGSYDIPESETPAPMRTTRSVCIAPVGDVPLSTV
jgi:hypothetical protein